MYDLYPYFTNDGTVGLFSPQDDDIYHSTYGAITESWQKFIIPSRLQDFIRTNESVKILDICYGIGYNSKVALNVFVENFFKKNDKKYLSFDPTIAAIYTDNIDAGKTEEQKENFCKKVEKNKKITTCKSSSYAAIDTDNIKSEICKEILIDAVDLDETLINISPFIEIEPKYKQSILGINGESNDKLLQVQKIKNSTANRLPKHYRLNTEISIILLEKMLENNNRLFDDENLQQILNEKKYRPFLSKFMLNLSKFYKNGGYKNISKQNKSTFLHNIYYQYLSRSYKKAKKVLKTAKVDLNFHPKDARRFIEATETKYDFIFLDAFTPAKCPALWSVEFFKELYNRLNENGMILTYSNSAAIRNAFLQNGFFVGKTYDKNLKKFIGTIAVKNKKFIEHELDDYDIGLMNSRAGICYRDENLSLDNNTIITNRLEEAENSELMSSSKFLKGYKNAK